MKCVLKGHDAGWDDLGPGGDKFFPKRRSRAKQMLGATVSASTGDCSERASRYWKNFDSVTKIGPGRIATEIRKKYVGKE